MILCDIVVATGRLSFALARSRLDTWARGDDAEHFNRNPRGGRGIRRTGLRPVPIRTGRRPVLRLRLGRAASANRQRDGMSIRVDVGFAPRARAQGGPNVRLDAVGDEADGAVGQEDVDAA